MGEARRVQLSRRQVGCLNEYLANLRPGESLVVNGSLLVKVGDTFGVCLRVTSTYRRCAERFVIKWDWFEEVYLKIAGEKRQWDSVEHCRSTSEFLGELCC